MKLRDFKRLISCDETDEITIYYFKDDGTIDFLIINKRDVVNFCLNESKYNDEMLQFYINFYEINEQEVYKIRGYNAEGYNGLEIRVKGVW